MNEDKKIDLKLILSIVATGIMSFFRRCSRDCHECHLSFFNWKNSRFGTSSVQWITTGYLLVLAVIHPTSSYLKNRFPYEITSL